MVRRYYECVTGVYRRFWGDSYHFAIYRDNETREQALAATERMIAEEGEFRAGLAILDLGSGLGGPAIQIAQYSGASITGIDLCEHHVHLAHSRAHSHGVTGKVRFAVADGMQLPFRDASFDRVYIFEAGCHTPDKAALCRECARVLCAGGEFLGLDWMQRDGLTAAQQERYIEPICRHCSVPSMISPADMRNLLERAGFDVLVSEEAAAAESLSRNWIPPQGPINFATEGWDADALRRVSLGGQVLEEATRAGAFVIGHWRGKKLP
jgi:ubiquinone/menaquinone biosynthesis C-methylase UbiE